MIVFYDTSPALTNTQNFDMIQIIMSEPGGRDLKIKGTAENLAAKPQELVEIPFDADRVRPHAELEQWAENILTHTFADDRKKWRIEELEQERGRIEEALNFFLTARGITNLPNEVLVQRQVTLVSGFPRFFANKATFQITISQQGKAVVRFIR